MLSALASDFLPNMSPVSTEDDFAEPDHVLMARVAHGDEEAFRSLVERHQYSVIGTISKMLGGSSEAEDLAQQVFIRVWKAAGRYRPDAKFTTWLMTITRNLVFNESRRVTRASMISLDGAGVDMPPPAASITQHHAGREVLDRELADRVEQAIASLPEQQRMAIILLRYEEMSYEEIASVLGTSVSAVKSIIFRARHELRTLLQAYLE